MKGFLAFALSGLLIVGLSAVPPEHARWLALSLLVLVVLTPALGRYASAGRSSGEAVSHRGERGD